MSDSPFTRAAVVQSLRASLTDPELVALMRQAKRARDAGSPSVTCAIAGYDEDPRELRDIPEAVELCKRLVRLGYLSFLDVATTVREFPTFNRGTSLGAWEVWRLARHEYEAGTHKVPVAALARFIDKKLAYLNTVADDHLSRS
jgi:hypothetical protein